MLFGKSDEIPVKIKRGDKGRWISRIAGDERYRLGDRMGHRALNLAEKILVRLGWNGADNAARH